MNKYLSWVGLFAISTLVLGYSFVLVQDINTHRDLRSFLTVLWLFILTIGFIPVYYFQSIKLTIGWFKKVLRIIELILMLMVLFTNAGLVLFPTNFLMGPTRSWMNLVILLIPYYLIRWFCVQKNIVNPIVPIVICVLSLGLFFPISKQIPDRQNNEHKVTYFIASLEAQQADSISFFQPRLSKELLRLEKNLFSSYPESETKNRVHWLQENADARLYFGKLKRDAESRIIASTGAMGVVVYSGVDTVLVDFSFLHSKPRMTAFNANTNIDLLIWIAELQHILRTTQLKSFIESYSWYGLDNSNDSSSTAKALFIELDSNQMKELVLRHAYLDSLENSENDQITKYLLMLIAIIGLIVLFFYVPTFSLDQNTITRILVFVVIVVFEFILLMLDNLAQGYFSNPFFLLGMNILLAAGLVYLDGFIRNNFLKLYKLKSDA